MATSNQDEYYTYDNLYEVKTLDRGNIKGTKTEITGTPVYEQDFTYDITGNWTDYMTKVNGSTTLNQNGTHTVVNEIEKIDLANTYVAYDSAGNMTKCPKTNSWTTAYDLTYDAWNRLVSIKQGAATVGTYTYDGLDRRVKKVVSGTTTHFYYSDKWQILEERKGSSACTDRQFVWGLRYIDDLILRDRTTSSSSSVSCPSLDERLYVLHDYFSVTAVTNSSGSVLERYGYDAFGESRVMTSTFGSRSSSTYGWETRYDAYRWDSESDFYQVRYRYLHPTLGRWLTRDPIGELGTPNLYANVRNNIITRIDPLGLREESELSKSLNEVFENIRSEVEHAKTAKEILDEISEAVSKGELNPATPGAALSGVLGIGGIPAGFVGALNRFTTSPDCRRMLNCAAQGNAGNCSQNASGCALDLGVAISEETNSSLGAAFIDKIREKLIKKLCHG